MRFVEKNNLDNFIFVLGGSYFKDFENILNENIENLGEKKDKILKIGYVDDEDMSALYSGAEMFLYPSLYEGFGIPVLEAMKCGLPVICSNTTSLPEVIGDCGIKINPYSDAEMLAAMEKMYFDRDFREECITKGIDRSKMFTWKKCVDVIQNKIIGDIWGAK
ncbi:glycosyl transferase group 1 [Clostridium sp. CAG:768]|nr:glycosyl transferase group 1 [Clostridium sp. CAG:768]